MAMLHVKKSQGFVLLIVMIYLQALMLTGAVVMRVLDRDLRKHVAGVRLLGLTYQAEKLLGNLERTAGTTCVVPLVSPVSLRKKPMSWWKGAACHGVLAGNEYYFAKEILNPDRNGLVKTMNKQQLSATIYRNTLLYVSRVNQFGSVLLQSTTAVPGGENGAVAKRLMLRRLW
jgi:hypothetical protein